MKKVPTKSPFATDYKYIAPTEENNMAIATFLTNNISDKLNKIIENDANAQISVGTDNKTITMDIISNAIGLKLSNLKN